MFDKAIRTTCACYLQVGTTCAKHSPHNHNSVKNDAHFASTTRTRGKRLSKSLPAVLQTSPNSSHTTFRNISANCEDANHMARYHSILSWLEEDQHKDLHRALNDISEKLKDVSTLSYGNSYPQDLNQEHIYRSQDRILQFMGSWSDEVSINPQLEDPDVLHDIHRYANQTSEFEKNF